MVEHTKGPWKADIDGPFTLDGDTISIEAVTPDGKMVRREICTLLIDTEENDDTPEAMEDKANALLIAAAPELLAACERVHGLLLADEDILTEEDWRAVGKQLYAVIAKATGARP